MEDVSFTNPPPVEFETDEAHFGLADGRLICEMMVHFANADDAEHAWLEAAVKTLIWHLGDTRNGLALPVITMADLPNL